MDVKVKICGLTNLADAQAALAGGADLLGFIFFPRSPRYVTPEQVRDILAGLEPHRQVGQGGVLTVGVFVNEPQLRGGTGETGDWRLATSLADQYPLLLAGGLSPANVAQAVQAVRPWGVDVSSGVEQSPGQEDHAALRAFIAAAKQMAASGEEIVSDR